MILTILLTWIYLVSDIYGDVTNNTCSATSNCEYSYDVSSPAQCYCADQCTDNGKRLLCFYSGTLKNNCDAGCMPTNMISSCADLCCKRDCTPEPWQEWSACQGPCGNKTGTRSRTRIVLPNKTDLCGGSECPPLSATETCMTNCCVVDCQWSTWSVWGPCNNQCGDGYQFSVRSHLQDASCGGLDCVGSPTMNTTCTVYNNVDCLMDSWSEWTACKLNNGKCGAGVQNRTRSIIRPAACKGTPCASTNETMVCQGPCCKQDCAMNVWSTWSFCNVSCGEGSQNRSRTILQVNACGGVACPSDLFQTQPCIKNETRNCNLTVWSKWSTCSNSCGPGYISRSRVIVLDEACGGTCDTNLTMNDTCESYTANVNCQVSQWSVWSACAMTCQGGVKTRTRNITINSKCQGIVCPVLTENSTCGNLCSQLCNNGVCSCNQGYTLSADNYTCLQIFCLTMPNVNYAPPGLIKTLQYDSVTYKCPNSTVAAGDVCVVSCSRSDWTVRGNVNNYTCGTSGSFNYQSMYCAPPNYKPTNITLDNYRVKEEITTNLCFGTFTTIDPFEIFNTYNYSLTNNFQNRLRINGSSLCLNYVPNYEKPNNTWPILVRSTDMGNLYIEMWFNISLININDPPSSCSFDTDGSIPENVGLNYFVGYLIFQDEDQDMNLITPYITYSKSDNFEIFYNDSDTVKKYGIRVKTASSTQCQTRGGLACNLNYEIMNTLQISIEADEVGTPATISYFNLHIKLLDRNDAPTRVFMNVTKITEDLKPGQTIGSFSIEDEDNKTQSYQYRLVNGNTEYFRIDNQQDLILLKELNYEDANLPNLSLLVEGKDDGVPPMTVTSNIILTVADVNEPPKISWVTNSQFLQNIFQIEIQERNSINATLATIHITDPDAIDKLTYVLNGAKQFIKLQDTGCQAQQTQVQFTTCGLDVIATAIFNYSEKSYLEFNISITDAGNLTTIGSFNLTVLRVIDNQINIVFMTTDSSTTAIDENIVGANISMLIRDNGQALDPNSLLLIADSNELFVIMDDGMLRLQDNKFLDYEGGTNANSIVVGIRDPIDQNYTWSSNLTVMAKNVNEPPNGIILSNVQVCENATEGFIIGSLSVTDPDFGDAISFKMINSTNNAFYIKLNELRVTRTNSTKLNYELSSEEIVVIEAVDSGLLSCRKSFRITIIDSNDPPYNFGITNARLSENSLPGTFVGQCYSSDEDLGQKIFYKINGQNSQFILSLDGRLTSNQTFDYETVSSINVPVVYFDDGTPSKTTSTYVTVTIINVNEPPRIISGPSTEMYITENQIGNLRNITAVDPDSGDHLKFMCQLVGTNDSCPVSLQQTCTQDSNHNLLCSASINVTTPLNYEQRNTYSMNIRVTDGDDQTDVIQLNLRVLDANEPVGNIMFNGKSAATVTIEENVAGVVLGRFTFIDPDNAQDHVVTIVDVLPPDGLRILAVKDRDLKINDGYSFNFELHWNYTIFLRVTDNSTDPLHSDFTMTLLVANVNEAPLAVARSNLSITENSPNKMVITTLTASDPDNLNEWRQDILYTIQEDELNAFEIVGDKLMIKDNSNLNFETHNETIITVKVSDNTSVSLSVVVQIQMMILDVNDPPTNLVLTNNIVVCDAPANSKIGTVLFTDEDNHQIHTFTILSAQPPNVLEYFQVDTSGDLWKILPDNIYDQQVQLVITVTDNGNPSLNASKQFELVIVKRMIKVYRCAIVLNALLDKIPEDVIIGESIGTMETIVGPEDELKNITLHPSDTDSYLATRNLMCRLTGGNYTCSVDLIMTKSLDYEDKSAINVNAQLISGNGARASVSHTIDVQDVNEQPTNIISIPEELRIMENSPDLVKICQFKVSDPDQTDVANLQLISAFPQIKLDGDILFTTSINFDYENISRIAFQVKVTDKGNLSRVQDFLLKVLDINEPPAKLSPTIIEIYENITHDQILTTFNVEDPDDNQTYTFHIIGYSDGNFKISENHLVMSINDSLCYEKSHACGFNYELGSTNYNITVLVTDSGQPPQSSEFSIGIIILNVNDAPTLLSISKTTIDEGMAIGSIVGQLTVTDEDPMDVYRCSVGSDSGFSVNDELCLVIMKTLDYEKEKHCNVEVKCTASNGQSISKVFDIAVTNINEAPNRISTGVNESSLLLSVEDGAPSNQLIGSLYAFDPDNNDLLLVQCNTTSVKCQNINCQAQFPSGTICKAVVSIGNAGDFNFENDSSLSFVVVVTDQQSKIFQETVVIRLIKAANRPMILLLNGKTGYSIAIEENLSNAFIGTLSVTDDDKENKCHFTISDDLSAFFIIRNFNELWTSENTLLDFESNTEYFVTVEAVKDDKVLARQTFFINVTDVNEPQYAISFSNKMVLEDIVPMSFVASIITDDYDNPHGNQTFQYQLLTWNSTFGIMNNTLILLEGHKLDYETTAVYMLAMQVTDSGTPSITTVFEVKLGVGNVNEIPENLTLSANHIDENSDIGTLVGMLTASDFDDGTQLVYTLQSDESNFEIRGNKLLSGRIFDFEVIGVHKVNITVTDNGQPPMMTSAVFEIFVIDVNESPNIKVESMYGKQATILYVPENNQIGTIIGFISVHDPDINDSMVCSIYPENKEFMLKEIFRNQSCNNFSIITQNSFDFEKANEFVISFKAVDSWNITDNCLVTVKVTDINEAPYSISINGGANESSISINENIIGPHIILSVSVVDPDGTDAHRYYIDSCRNCEGKFEFINNQSRLYLAEGESFDYETMKNVDMEMTIKVVDSGDLFITRTIKVVIVNTRDPPVITGLNISSIPDYFDAGYTFGSIEVASGDDLSAVWEISCKLVTYCDWLRVVNISNTQVLESRRMAFLNQSFVTLEIECQDRESPPLSVTANITLPVRDIGNEPKEIALENLVKQIYENQSNVILGRLALRTEISKKPLALINANISYSWPPRLNITLGDDGTIVLGSAVSYEDTRSFDMQFTMVDSSRRESVQSTIIVLDVNESPTRLQFDVGTVVVLETKGSGVLIGTLIANDEDENQNHVYEIVNITGYRADNSVGVNMKPTVLQLHGNQLYSADPLNGFSSLNVTIRCTDDGSPSLALEASLMVMVKINEAPTEIVFSAANISIPESAPVNTTLVSLVVKDDNINDTQACISSNSKFAIANFSIFLHEGLNYENSSLEETMITCTDSGGLSVSAHWSIIVENVNESPDNVMLTNSSWDEDVPSQILIASLSATDPDGTNCYFELMRCENVHCPFIVLENGSIFTNQSLTEITTTDELRIHVRVFDKQNDTGEYQINATIIRHHLPIISINVFNVFNIPENTTPGTKLFDIDIVFLSEYKSNVYCQATTAGDAVAVHGFETVLHKFLDYESSTSLAVNLTCWKNSYQMLSWVSVTLNLTNIDEPILEIILNISSSLAEGSYLNQSLGNIIIKDPENDRTNILCYGIAANLSIQPSYSDTQLLSYLVAITGHLDYEELRYGYNFSIVCEDRVSSLTKNVSLLVLDINDAPSDLVVNGSMTVDLDFAHNYDIIAALQVIDDDISQTHDIIVQSPGDKYFSVNQDRNLEVKNLEYAWVGFFNCSFLVTDNGFPALTMVFTKTFNFIKSNGEVSLSNYTIDITAKANSTIASIQFSSKLSVNSVRFKLENVPYDAFAVNGQYLILLINADQIAFKKINLKIVVYSADNDERISEANIRLDITGFSICQSTLNICSANSSCVSIEGNMTSFRCDCNQGFHDLVGRCEEIDECDSRPCAGDLSICVDLVNDFLCQCEPNRSGRTCSTILTDHNYCENIPCVNGICQNDSCTCSTGWHGAACNESINDCTEDSCHNNGVCEDHHLGYGCRCSPNFCGIFCEYNTSVCGHCLHVDDCIVVHENRFYCVTDQDKISINFTVTDTGSMDVPYFKVMFYRFLQMIPDFVNDTIYLRVDQIDSTQYQLWIASFDSAGQSMLNDDSWKMMETDCLARSLTPESVTCQKVFNANTTTTAGETSKTSLRTNVSVILLVTVILLELFILK